MKRTAVALAVATLLASCGGGGDQPATGWGRLPMAATASPQVPPPQSNGEIK